MAMSKRDESNKEKTTSSYNLPSTPISSATTINPSQLATTSTNIANAYQPSIPFPNNEEPRATSHPPLSDPRSTNQGLKNDAQAVADLLALADASSNSPPSYEESLRSFGNKRPSSPPSPPDAGYKKRRLSPPAAGSKRSSRTPTGEQPFQFVPYSPKPPQPKRKSDVIPDEPTHSTPSPGLAPAHLTRSSTSSAAISAPFQPFPGRTAPYTQLSTIAPGPFSPTVAPQLYVPHISPPTQLPMVPAPMTIAQQTPIITSPWPAVASPNYQSPPTTLPPQQQYFASPPPSLEQLVQQRLQNINYTSTGTELPLLKRCLPDQPLTFFRTNVKSSSHAQVAAGPPEAHNTLRPFVDATNEAAAPIESLPHLNQLIQTSEVAFDASRSAVPAVETTRGPPKKLPLHFVQ